MIDEFEGDNTRHAAVASYLDLLGVPCTGSEPMCLTLCQDRARSHVLVAEAEIPLPRFAIIRDLNAIPDTGDFRFPVIVTQAYDDLYEEEGNERAIYDREELVARTAELFHEFELPYLIEEYIEHRRIHAVVVGNRAPEVLPLVELAEYSEAGASIVDSPWALAQLDYATLDRVRQLAIRAFRAMGCRDVAVIDFHLDDDSEVYVVDVRPMFEIGPDSAFRGACAYSERGFDRVIADIARAACRRLHLDAPLSLPHGVESVGGLLAGSAASQPVGRAPGSAIEAAPDPGAAPTVEPENQPGGQEAGESPSRPDSEPSSNSSSTE